MTGPMMLTLLSLQSARSILSSDHVLTTIAITPLIGGAILLGSIAVFVLMYVLSHSKLHTRSAELRKARVDARRSRAFLDTAQRVARIGTWEYMLASREMVWSDHLYLILGLSGEDVDADYDRFLEIVHPEDRELVREAAARAVQGQDFYELEYRIVRPDGQVRSVRDEARLVRDSSNRAVSLQGTIHDVTGEKDASERAQRLETRALHSQKLENLAIMIGGIAHEFNNLLTGILGNAEVALQKLPEGSPARDSLLGIRESASRVERLTCQMLDYAEHESSEKTGLNVSVVVDGMKKLLQAAVGRKIVVYFELEDDLPEVMVDPYRLQQVIMNLSVSAGRAVAGSAPGSAVQGEVRISTGFGEFTRVDLADAVTADPVPGKYVVLRVSDNGVPMGPDYLDCLSGSDHVITQDEAKLGLLVISSIVREYGGLILVRTGKARGSTVSILLPAVRVWEEVLQIQEEPRPEVPVPTPAGGRSKILLVDDEEVVREIGRQLLDILGFPVITAPDGSSALVKLREFPGEIGMVLLDMTMPGLSGRETLTLIRRFSPTLRVVICSGYSEEDVIREFEGCDIAGILHKPYSSEDLAGLLYSISKTDR